MNYNYSGYFDLFTEFKSIKCRTRTTIKKCGEETPFQEFGGIPWFSRLLEIGRVVSMV